MDVSSQGRLVPESIIRDFSFGDTTVGDEVSNIALL